MTSLYRMIAVLLLALLAAPAAAYECQPLELREPAAAVDIRHDRGLLWRISKPGSATSYLYGTIHVSDPEITDLPEPVLAALADASHFVMEAELDGPAMLGFAQQMFYSDGRRLSEQLDDDLYTRAEDLLGRHGVPPLAAQSLKPWAAFMTLNMPPDNGLPLDLVLMEKAEQRGMSVRGLETMEEQLAVFADLDESAQLRLLVDTLCHYEDLQRDMAQMKTLYRQRDLAGLFRYHNKYNLQDRAVYKQLMQRLLWDRNRVMAQRIAAIIAEDDAFVAIGAMHLPGAEGVLTLLENAGFKVQMVY
ncbi:uncharacterized protein YbaP (TraB family) [Methylohalomonas lacus]|uniref:Uncharacterized protein YbaP (TraB family) n=2 Tax=Methylohalomonas lacus TaxID=398773 RepID=A0AAE3L4I9_9GAMM|nr:uncharacterized protein YbaP (TraB family) [Methylohalomonas lacus]